MEASYPIELKQSYCFKCISTTLLLPTYCCYIQFTATLHTILVILTTDNQVIWYHSTRNGTSLHTPG